MTSSWSLLWLPAIPHYHLPAELVQCNCPYSPCSPWQMPNPARSNHERPLSVSSLLGTECYHVYVCQPSWCLILIIKTIHRRVSMCIMGVLWRGSPAEGLNDWPHGLVIAPPPGIAIYCSSVMHVQARHRVAKFANLVESWYTSKTLTLQVITTLYMILHSRLCFVIIIIPREIYIFNVWDKCSGISGYVCSHTMICQHLVPRISRRPACMW